LLLSLAFVVSPAGAAAVDAPTFSRDVAPIFFNNCSKCHRPGEVAPMSLLSYQEARPWAKSIARAVQNKEMPPFSGDSDHYQWANDIRLDGDQIDTITRWVEQGAKEGDPADLPEAPTFSNGWTLGEPDLVITLDPVDVPAAGEDIFPKQRHVLDLDEPKWVRAIEFLPGERKVTHHFQSTYNSPSVAGGAGNTGIFAIWTAGMPPYVFPEGMGRTLNPGTTIQLDLHYHPMGEAATDVTRIGVYFGKGEMKKEVATIPVTNTGLRIPPGAEHHPENAHYLFDKDMQILALSPHMHVRGKAMKYELTHPDGTRETLLDVPDYDYNWQWLYYPTEPIDVPAGSRLDVTAVWDNSANNPANPDPTKEIIYRGDTFSEMFNGFIEVVQKDGVYHQPQKPQDKIASLLALHPSDSSFLVNSFLKLGFYAPRDGEGWLYLANGLVVFSISLDDFQWSGNDLKITTQFPTLEASAMTTLIEGTVGDDGRFTGNLILGTDAGAPQKIPIVGMPLESGSPASGG
jgi:hypothetical protein